MTNHQSIRTAILGASGYTGAELLRLLASHPQVEVVALTGDSQAGKRMGEVYPHLARWRDYVLVRHEEVDFDTVDAVFCCLPHGTTQPIIAKLPDHVKIIDLSADFRLHDANAYATWYGHAHLATGLQKEAVYGLTEWRRDEICEARLIANPGCYPTCSLLPLLPLLRDGLIEAEGIIIDALSGVSGAGRGVKQNLLFCEVNEAAGAYGVASHRHAAEMEQEIALAAGKAAMVSFTPHLVPVNRGMVATIHVNLVGDANANAITACWQRAYGNEPFMTLSEIVPNMQHVRGTNRICMKAFDDRVQGRAIITSAIDNLGKGASGQAVQNFNLCFGLPETTGLMAEAVMP